MRFGRNAGKAGKAIRSRPAGLNPSHVAEGELRPSEKLIWAAKPTSLRSHLIGKVFTALFGIPFLAFAVFWISKAAEMGGGQGFDFFPLFGIPFVLVGVGMVLSPLYAVYVAEHTVYALTDQRLVIIEDSWRKSVRSWTLDQADEIERRDNIDGSCNLYFATSVHRGSKGSTYTKRHGFIGIDGGDDLEYQITRLRDSGE